MATKAEKEALEELVFQIGNLEVWLDDTMYPASARVALEAAIKDVKTAFAIYHKVDKALTEAVQCGATHRDGRDPNTFYKQEKYETLKAVYDGEVLTMWRWYSTYPPESAGVI